jgi:Peptidyl-tRNA hydrolase.
MLGNVSGGDITYIKQKSSPTYVAFFKTNSFMNISGTPVKSAVKFCEV